MSAGKWFSERKWSETVVGLEEGVGLSTGRLCAVCYIVGSVPCK